MKILDGKVCMVTGAHRGIGAAILRRFVEEGATVYANARKENSLDERCAVLSDTDPGVAIPVYFDVTDVAALKTTALRIKREQGHWDVLVNNAGIMEDAMLGMISDEMIRRTMAVNVEAPIHAMQLASKLMVRQKSGSIINMASLVGTNGNKNQILYAASKGAVISMTKSAAKELAPFNVRVNAVAPGMVDTDLFHQVGDRADGFIAQIGMGHLANPEDVANVCVFLASNLSSYVTGQILGVDGAAVM